MIAVQPGYSDREFLAVLQSGVRHYRGEPKEPSHTVVGSVEWCERFLDPKPVPDYYPMWARDFMYRHTWRSERWQIGKIVFIKPADRYKRFTGFVTKDWGCTGKQRGPYMVSTPVKFTQEWRYYVAAGEVLTAGWYDGTDEDEPAPTIEMFPEHVYGAVDTGRLSTGDLALVEYQHPYACGWYGDSSDHKKYVDWLIAGWAWLKEGNR